MNEETGIIDQTYKVYPLDEVLKMPIEKTSFLMRPTIQEKGLTLIYGNRGSGKTFYALGMALALASGINFAGNTCNTPQQVLYVDGEMDPFETKERLEWLKNGFEMEGKTTHPENLHMFMVGLQGEDMQMPVLSKEDDQKNLEDIMKKHNIKVAFLDNIYTLYCPCDENDASSWAEYNDFNKKERQKGRSLVWIHHTGKDASRGPRGSSAIETLLNTSVFINKIKPKHPNDGLTIEVEYTKTRSTSGDEVAKKKYSLEVYTCTTYNQKPYAKWIEEKTEDDEKKEEALRLRDEGLTIKEIAKEMGINKTKAGDFVNGVKKGKTKKKEDTNTQKQSLTTE